MNSNDEMFWFMTVMAVFSAVIIVGLPPHNWFDIPLGIAAFVGLEIYNFLVWRLRRR